MTEKSTRYEVLDSEGKPVPEDFLTSKEWEQFEETFNKVVSYGWVGEGVTFYGYRRGRRSAFFTEPFNIVTLSDDDFGLARSKETGDFIDPLFAVWSKVTEL